MKRKLIFLLILLPLLFAGCAQNIRTANLDVRERIPTNSYEAYFFVAGDSERSRAVLLRQPDSDVEVVPFSPEITSTTSSYSEAMYFMKAKRGMRDISTQKVYYKDKFVGYLITYERERANIEEMTVNIFERGGKIYFSARENISVDD